jgi:Holliday junction resolvase RusA-like endonuclease
MITFKFTVPGAPQHKRSGTPFYNKYTELTRMVPNSKNKPAGKVIQQAAIAAGWTGEAFDGAIFLSCKFYFPVPKSYSKAKREKALKSFHTSMPDLDRLHNQIQDALSGYWKSFKDETGKKRKERKPGLMWHDDSQVCGYVDSRKMYSVEPRTEISVLFMGTPFDVYEED